MILTTKARYAVMAVIEIADNKTNQPVSLLTISPSSAVENLRASTLVLSSSFASPLFIPVFYIRIALYRLDSVALVRPFV